MQAHALAAGRLGFAPELFFVGPRDTEVDSDCGVLRRVGTPLRHPNVATVHRRALARAIADHLVDSRHGGPHAVHSFGPWSGTGVLACAMLAARGVPAVAVASAYTTVSHEWRALIAGQHRSDGTAIRRYLAWYPWVVTAGAQAERRGYLQSRVVLVNYASVRELVERECGPAVNVRTIPYAAPSAFHDRPQPASRSRPAAIAELAPADAPLIVSVSRHDPRKGLDVLLRALAILREENVAFRACLVGGGRLIEAHRRLAASFGLSGNVAITGRVEDVFDYLGDADVFVLPSREEGSGSVSLLEALQAGVAVVATRCDGIPEDIADRRDGLLVPPGDPPALAGALRQVIEDGALRARLARRAHELYRERFAADPFVEALGDVYSQLGVRVR